MTNWKNKKLMEEGKLSPLPKKAPSPAPPPKKNYPVHHHDHPYADATMHLNTMAERNRQLEAENAKLKARVAALEGEGMSGWHPYRGCGDAPNVKDYQKETYLCMVQRYAKATGEEVGAVSYQVLLCDANGMFWGLKSDSLVDYKVIAWKEIAGRDYEDAALAYQRQ